MQIDILAPWGKARPNDQGPSCHPLVFHMHEVRAVALAIFDQDSGLRRRLVSLSGLTEIPLRQIVAVLAYLHDLGKCAVRFQMKVPDACPSDLFDSSISTHFDHGAALYRLFLIQHQSVASLLPFTESVEVLLQCASGHHGAPTVDHGDDPDVAALKVEQDFSSCGLQYATAISEACLIQPPDEWPDCEAATALSWPLAGLITLADWIASNTDFFPYRDRREGADLGLFVNESVERAREVVSSIGILPAKLAENLTIHDLIGNENVPRPMQSAISSLPISAGPNFYIIEDDTGSGKTEAALLLAHRLMASGCGDGVYLGLPTAATANGLYARLSDSYRQLFDQAATPSLVLAHGARNQNDRYRASVLPAWSSDCGQIPGETNASGPACAAYIADERRLAFLADVGTGTIDQALLAVLHKRYQALRLLGLHRKILVLDEIHAYDAYVGAEIEALIKMHAFLGGSTILLSATLPSSLREKYLRAFHSSCGRRWVGGGDALAYPLVTSASAEDVSVLKVASDPERRREIAVDCVGDIPTVIREIERAVAAGLAVAWIRNTVSDVLDGAALLDHLKPIVFHSRFLGCDRSRIENSVLEIFGRNGAPDGRRGKIIVASQVIEQSLDLDFDLIVTDLAPIDLIIQRLGRLWRHKRAERSGTPRLIVLGPIATDTPDRTWYSRVFPRAAYVYQKPAILWRTMQELATGLIVAPDDFRSLVERVYVSDAVIPDAFKKDQLQQEGKDLGKRGIAQIHVSDPEKGYQSDHLCSEDGEFGTRLDETNKRVVRLGVLAGHRIVPAGSGGWTLSEVSLSASDRKGVPELPSALEAKARWGEREQAIPLWLLERDEDGRMRVAGAPDRIYDSIRGFLREAKDR